MSFGIIDIVICVIVLIAALIGLKKGFVKMIVKSLAFIGAIVVAILFFKYVAQVLNGTSLYTSLFDKVFAWVNSKDETAMAVTMGTAGEDGVKSAISALGVPGFLTNLISKQVSSGVTNNPDMAVGEFLATFITATSITLISFLGLFLVSFIVLSVVCKFLKKLSELPVIGLVDKLLGLALSVVVAAVIICVLMVAVNYLVTLPTIGEKISSFMTSDMKLEDDTVTGIAKYLYTQNPLLEILEKIGLGDVVDKFATPTTDSAEEAMMFIQTIIK